MENSPSLERFVQAYTKLYKNYRSYDGVPEIAKGLLYRSTLENMNTLVNNLLDTRDFIGKKYLVEAAVKGIEDNYNTENATEIKNTIKRSKLRDLRETNQLLRELYTVFNSAEKYDRDQLILYLESGKALPESIKQRPIGVNYFQTSAGILIRTLLQMGYDSNILNKKLKDINTDITTKQDRYTIELVKELTNTTPESQDEIFSKYMGKIPDSVLTNIKTSIDTGSLSNVINTISGVPNPEGYSQRGELLAERLSTMLLAKMEKVINLPIGAPISSDMFRLTKDENVMLKSAIRWPSLASGAQGSVFAFNGNPDYIIKESTCPTPFTNSRDLVKSCDMLENGTLYQTVNSANMTELISMPDTVSENVVGVILGELEDYTGGFVKNYGTAWETTNSYAMIETLQTDLFTNKIKNGSDVLIMLVQYLQALAVGQQMQQFTHNDSHLDNILADEEKMDWTHLYVNSFDSSARSPTQPSTVQDFYLRNSGWSIKINDYGLSRLRRNNKIYTGVKSAMRNFGGFSHANDYMSLLGFMANPYFSCVQYRKGDPTTGLFNMHTKMKEILMNDTLLLQAAAAAGFVQNSQRDVPVARWLYSFAVNHDMINDADSLFFSVYPRTPRFPDLFWRPNGNELFKSSTFFYTPDRIILNMLPTLQSLGLASPSLPDGSVKEYLNYSPIFNNHPHQIVSINETIANEPILPGINGGILAVVSSEIASVAIRGAVQKSEYNIADNISGCRLNQYVHVVSIDLKQLSGSGYRMVSECCGGDTLGYFDDPERFGVAINGAFFDITKSDFPIGPYKNNIYPIQERNTIPEMYAKHYGFIGWSNSTDTTPGKVEIGKTKDNLDQFEFVATCGPILIDRPNNFVFSERELYEQIDNGDGPIRYLNCVIPKGKASGDILEPGVPYTSCNPNGTQTNMVTTVKMPSCNTIKPGELSHGSNLNPRSCMGINATKGILYFVVIEGRNTRGSGQDFPMMATTMLQIDPGMTTAINLDGGGSSNIAMRTPTNPGVVVGVNPTKLSPYAMGNIFAITNK